MKNVTKPISNQDAFDRVYQHFIIENHPRCLGASGKCAYRNAEKTNGCALGCMLPDNLWRKEDEGLCYNSLRKRMDIAEWFENVSVGLLEDLQSLHDDTKMSTKEFKAVAAKHLLNCLGLNH